MQAQDFAISNGSSQDYLAIEGDGSDYQLDVVYDFGTDFSTDKIRNLCQVRINASCDQVVAVDCVVDGGPVELGNIVGNVSLQGETLTDYGHLTRMQAVYGPYSNIRYDEVAGAGPFDLQNLVPSNVVDPELGYIVFGEMGLRSGYNYQYLRTAQLNDSNGRVMVSPGAATDLAGIFDLVPGFVRGNIELVGPVSDSNALAHIYRDADVYTNSEGIPTNLYLSNSHLSAYGTNQRAQGARYNTSGAYARAGFAGSYASATGNFAGSYEMALAGLDGEASIWALNDLVLRFDNSATRSTSESPLLNAYIRVHSNQLGYRQINPGEAQQVDHSYCFNDVQLAYKTLAGVFYNPNLRATGNFKGEDHRKQLVDYRSYVDYARGLPLNKLTASNTGVVSLSLPQGFYDISPEVSAINPDGSQTTTELPAITLNVGCGQVIKASTDIQVSVGDLPQSTETNSILIEGEINANTAIASIDYVQNEQPAVIVCDSGDCASEGVFSAEVPLDAGSNNITVTATADDGSQASVSVTIEYSEPEPLAPIVLSQCNDIRSIAENSISTAVNFEPVATGGCSIPQITCNASSGSQFDIGNHTVRCEAVDQCEQKTTCDFAISVEAPAVAEPEVIEPEEENSEESGGDSNAGNGDNECQLDPAIAVIAATQSVNVLWSPNHELVPVGYSITLNHCDEHLSDTLSTKVYSDEEEMPGQGRGNGQHAADAVMTGQGVALRSERDGNSDGRVYLLISEVVDSSELTHRSCSAVVVPHDKKADSLSDVVAQAQAAVRYCQQQGTAPVGYSEQGVSEALGPKQTFKTQARRQDFLFTELSEYPVEIITTDAVVEIVTSDVVVEEAVVEQAVVEQAVVAVIIEPAKQQAAKQCKKGRKGKKCRLAKQKEECKKSNSCKAKKNRRN